MFELSGSHFGFRVQSLKPRVVCREWVLRSVSIALQIDFKRGTGYTLATIWAHTPVLGTTGQGDPSQS